MNKNYKKVFLHHIYAIVEPSVDVVYVGKTTIKNSHKKRIDVINGKVGAVAGEFSEKCKFHLLESLYVSKADAFRHILAWYRFFENNGFEILVSGKAANMLEIPKDKTDNIYNEVCLPYSLEEVLKRNVLQLVEEDDEENSQVEQSPYTQLNIRVREDVADSFRYVSRNLKLSQNDTLKLLLSEKDYEMKLSLVNGISTLKQEKQNYKELLKQKQKQHKEDMSNALEKYKKLVEISNNSINLLVELLESVPKEEIQPLHINEEYGNKLFHSYTYPDTAGCCLAMLEEIVIGKLRTSQSGNVVATKFLLFKTLNGEKMKLRLFEKTQFIGHYPITYAHKNSIWIVGYTISNDLGGNMVLGIPLDFIYNQLPEGNNTVFEEKKLSALEDLISSAEDNKLFY